MVKRHIGPFRGYLDSAVLAEPSEEGRGIVSYAGAGGRQGREEADGH
jgi:hypothetical protein